MTAQEDGRGNGAFYQTFVLRHDSDEERRAAFIHMMERWPFAIDGESASATRVTAWSEGDATSISEAATMALECRELAADERMELALDILQLQTWEACLAKFDEWEMEIDSGKLVDKREPQP